MNRREAVALLAVGGISVWMQIRDGTILGITGRPEGVSVAVDVVARTVWGEARGEGREGMQAVANVIANRVDRPGWWGRDWVSVCLKSRQFSAWNRRDPNRTKIVAVTADDPMFRQALDIAARAVAGTLPDITGGATHYHTRAVSPAWASSLELKGTIGNHIFYA